MVLDFIVLDFRNKLTHVCFPFLKPENQAPCTQLFVRLFFFVLFADFIFRNSEFPVLAWRS